MYLRHFTFTRFPFAANLEADELVRLGRSPRSRGPPAASARTARYRPAHPSVSVLATASISVTTLTGDIVLQAASMAVITSGVFSRRGREYYNRNSATLGGGLPITYTMNNRHKAFILLMVTA